MLELAGRSLMQYAQIKSTL